MMVVRWVVWSLAIVALGACGAAVPSGPATSATPGPSASASGSSVVTTSPTGSSAAERCHGDASVMYHDAPALEATLPTQVAGRDLATWSVADRCWLEILIDDDARIEEVLANGGDPAAIDVSRIAMAVAGRSDTKTDPPYFVYAVNRPQAQAEIELSLGLLMGGTGFRDLDTATRLDTYDQANVAGKEVFVGTTDMLRQSEHQRGKPYLYQTDDTMFLVITDDAAWAEEVFEQLP